MRRMHSVAIPHTHSLGRRARQGFTLVELLIVVAIVAILSAVAIPAYSKYVMKGRRADAVNALHAIVDAQERYRGSASAYADSLSTLKLDATLSSHYALSLSALSGHSLAVGYAVSATAKASSPQYADLDCRSFSITLEGGKLLYDAQRSDTVKNTKCWPQ